MMILCSLASMLLRVGETDDDPLFSGINVIKFNSDSFYVTQNAPNTDTAIINFRGSAGAGEANTASNLGAGEGVFAQKSGVDLQFKSLVAGTEISLSSDANEITINSTSGPGFYGIVVKDDVTVVKTDSIEFQGTDFDVSASGDGALVALDANVATLDDIPPGFYGIIVKDDAATVVKTDAIEFADADFDVTAAANNDAQITLDASVARLTDIPPGFYGIVVKDDVTTVVTDSIEFDGTDFDVTASGDGATVTLDVNIATLDDIPPGFYGIAVGETDDTPLFDGIEVIKFNSDSFYVTQQDTDTAIVNFRGSGAGEANTASNLGAGEGVFAQKAGVDLQFKSLVAGTEISLSSDANEITINSTSGPGFYGIVVKDDATTVVTDSIEFDGTDFDVAASGDGATVTLDASVAKLTDIPPGFYGIVVEESDGTNTQVDDTIRFLAADFIVSDVNNKPQIALETDVARLSDIGPGFYGIIVKDDVTTVVTDSIEFSGTDFDISASGDGALVQLDANVATLDDIPPGFYGIVVEESDGTGSQLEADVARLDDIPPGFYGIIVKDDASTVVNTDAIEFADADFNVVAAANNDAQITLDASVARLTDIPPGFYGIVVKDDATTVVTDSIEFSGTDFDVTASGDGATVTLDANIATLDDIPPGFYGITAKHQDDSASFSGLEVFSFDEFNFYLTQNDPNTDEVQIHLRNLPGASGGEANTGANVGSGQGNVFRDKTGVTLNFKTLLQGSNITITDNADDITIASTGGGGGGFYGVIFKESESGGAVFQDDTLVFDSAFFYLTSDGSDKPVVSLISATVGTQSQTFNAVEWIFTHNLNNSDLVWAAYDDADEALIPEKVDVSDPNVTYFYFAESTQGKAVIIAGGSVASGSGEANTASNRTGDEGIFFQKSGVDLEFKSLTAGTNITLSSDNDAITINSTGGGGGGGFYGIVVKDDVTTVVTDSIEFDGADFDVSASGDGALVQLDASVAKLTDIGPGFYGIVVEESDGTNTQKDDTIRFLATDFIVSNVSSKPQIALETDVARLDDIPPGFYGIVVKDDVTTVVTDSIEFSGTDFDVAASGDGATITLDANVATLDDIPPGFYGITVKHQDDSASFSGLDVLSFDEFNFYITQNSPNTDEVQIHLRNLPGAGGGETNLGANVGSGQGNVFRDKTGVTLNFKTLLQGSNITITDNADDITIAASGGGGGGPGFYGINVGHSDDSEMFSGINTIKFNQDSFYITQNTTNTDEVHVNLRRGPRAVVMTLETPTASEDFTIFFTPVAITISSIHAVVRGTGSPSVTIRPKQSTIRGATGTNILSADTAITSITSGQNLTSFNDNTVPAGSWIWLETTAIAGTTVDELNLTFFFEED
jgi:hypothetical protein